MPCGCRFNVNLYQIIRMDGWMDNQMNCVFFLLGSSLSQCPQLFQAPTVLQVSHLVCVTWSASSVSSGKFQPSTRPTNCIELWSLCPRYAPSEKNLIRYTRKLPLTSDLGPVCAGWATPHTQPLVHQHVVHEQKLF